MRAGGRVGGWWASAPSLRRLPPGRGRHSGRFPGRLAATRPASWPRRPSLFTVAAEGPAPRGGERAEARSVQGACGKGAAGVGADRRPAGLRGGRSALLSFCPVIGSWRRRAAGRQAEPFRVWHSPPPRWERRAAALPVADGCPSAPGRSASMNLCLTALCLCVGLALGAPRVDPDLDDHWELWKSWHSKDYHEVSARGWVLGSAGPLGRALPAESCLLCFSAVDVRSALGKDHALRPRSLPSVGVPAGLRCAPCFCYQGGKKPIS